ncbi:GntR family transcriptional regulator [Novosphingobium naphthalenivorans]|uniref:GntR family transcriptional regulator n=1 Tax=Novosphingobium naphthalenivorans TaxID=273168 RepID=UPI000A7E157A|nr:GntR family transcriptional regulator [Novosphingobium naphthalenivorans]
MSAKAATENEERWQAIGTSRQSLNNVVADALREAILSGRFEPGDRLPEPQLAEMFGVSRNPIREALQVLSNEGLVEISPRKGARVPLLSPEELLETIELRAELEGISARNAARHCNGTTRDTLVALLQRGNAALEAQDEEVLLECNSEFHVALAGAARNRYLAEFMRSLRDRTHWLFSRTARERITTSWNEHAAVLEAVIAGDAQRAAEMAFEHVQKVGESLVKQLKVDR